MQTINEVDVSKMSNLKDNDGKQYFIEDEKFQLLKQFQKLIFEATELSPAIRKIVNELITVDNLNQVKEKFIKSFNIHF